MPSLRNYIISIALITTGTLIAAVLTVSSMYSVFNYTKDMQSVQLPHQTQVEFKEAGAYTIFLEEASGNEILQSQLEAIAGMEFALTGTGNDEEIELQPCTYKSSYSLNGTAGESVFSAEVSTPGTYSFYATDAKDSQMPLTFTIKPSANIAAGIVYVVAGSFLSFALVCSGFVWLGITVLRLMLSTTESSETSEPAPAAVYPAANAYQGRH